MANYVGGNKLELNKEIITATANLPAKTLCTSAGAVPANAANTTYGVVQQDTKNADTATIVTSGIVEVIATGTVTKGSAVEALSAATFAMDIDGASVASQTGAGVQNYSAGYVLGVARTGGSANDTVLVELFANKYLKPV